MKNLLILCVGISVLASSCKSSSEISVSKSIKTAEAQLTYSLKNHTDKSSYPRSIKPDGSLKTVSSDDWTSGFYPGTMWYLYALTRDRKWADSAAVWNAGLESVKFNSHTHDLGFVLYCSFGNGLKLTENPEYAKIMLQGAQTLRKRFDPKVGSIKSWDMEKWQYPVSIDNMMNLELLFWATKYSGDSSFHDIAVRHADTTLKNHFRTDNSSYHVIDYDSITGEVRGKMTHQGFSDESAWTRGQAWGLYGFTVMYRETGDKKYLEQADGIADFFLNHPNLPDDLIPYWDFNASDTTDNPRDASSAAIAASALLELSRYSPDGERYYRAAEKMLTSLSSEEYLAKPKTNKGFILMHSTGNLPNNSEIDTPLNYADYYYLEGLLRYRMLNPDL